MVVPGKSAAVGLLARASWFGDGRTMMESAGLWHVRSLPCRVSTMPRLLRPTDAALPSSGWFVAEAITVLRALLGIIWR